MRRLGAFWRRGVPKPVVAVCLGVLVSLAVAEVALRLFASALPPGVSSALFTCYEPSLPERFMYGYLTPLETEVHLPGESRDCAFNGYFWHHQSDAFGWRNPETWEQTDVVLLGDSMIYGHGVEEVDTLAHRLRDQLGMRVTNLGSTGSCPTQYMSILRNFGLPLLPRVAVVFVFANDLEDISNYESEKRQTRFIARGVLPEARVIPRERLLDELFRVEPHGAGSWLRRLVVVRLLQYYLPSLRFADQEAGYPPPTPKPDAAARTQMAGIDALEPIDPEVVEALAQATPEGWHQRELLFTYRTLQLMAWSCSVQGTRLVIAYLPSLRREDAVADASLPRAMRVVADALGVDFFDATPALVRGEGEHAGRRKPGVYLPVDGHLSGTGAQAVAELLAGFLNEGPQHRGTEIQPPPTGQR